MVRRHSPGVHGLDGSGGPGDADVVDQHVEAAQPGHGLVEQPVDLGRISAIGERRAEAGRLGAEGGQLVSIDIADMHARAGGHEGPWQWLGRCRRRRR